MSEWEHIDRRMTALETRHDDILNRLERADRLNRDDHRRVFEKLEEIVIGISYAKGEVKGYRKGAEVSTNSPKKKRKTIFGVIAGMAAAVLLAIQEAREVFASILEHLHK